MSEPVVASYVLPAALITRADLSRLVREIEDLDNDLEAQKARNRATGATSYRMPNMSRALGDFIELNKLDLSDDQSRMLLKEQMKIMKDKAPILHMTFAVEADPASLQRLITYVRTEIHPQALLQVGMQPSLVGGVYLRTPNHIHDYSVRARLAGSRDVILHEIEGFAHVIPVVEPK